MKRALLAVSLLLFPSSALTQSSATKLPSKIANQPRFEIRVKPFIDLYFYLYKLASSGEKLPPIDGFAQAIETARQVPMYQPLIDLYLFKCENAADAERVFAQLPETFTTRQGSVIPLRERAIHLARSLAVIEKPFLEKIWPQHRDTIQKAATRISQTLEPKQEECFNFLTTRLGLEAVNYTVPIYLVAEMPWPAALTATGKETSHGVCVINASASPGSDLFAAVLHEAIHALDAETSGSGNVLIEFHNQLLKNGFTNDDFAVRNAPHFLVFIQSIETVRKFLDSSYQPYDRGVFIRPGLVPLVNVERPIWTAYLDGKFSRAEALNMMVAAFVKARQTEAPPGTTSSSPAIDRHNPEAVLRAYFDLWARNDTAVEKSFMTSNYADATWFPEPVDSVAMLSITLLDEKTARLWSSGSPDTTRVYLVVFDYMPRGRGFSMERGRYTWTYTLTWDAKRDSWLISNYGAG